MRQIGPEMTVSDAEERRLRGPSYRVDAVFITRKVKAGKPSLFTSSSLS